MPAASVLTGPLALTASLATTKPTLPAPARPPALAAVVVVVAAQAVLLEAPTTAPVWTLLASAASGPDILSALMASLAITLLTQPPLAPMVPLELVRGLGLVLGLEAVQDLAQALAVLDLA